MGSEMCIRDSRHTRRVVALVATHDVELAGNVGKRSGFDVFDPSAIYAQRDVMFALAGHRARMTANAVVAVEKETESRHRDILSQRGDP